MEGQFSGMISTIENNAPVKLKHHTIVDNSIDPRISVIKEYLSKVPNASLKDLKKALTGFSKASDSEFQNIIKLGSTTEQYQILYPNKVTKFVTAKPKSNFFLTDDEIAFSEKYKDLYLSNNCTFSPQERERIYADYLSQPHLDHKRPKRFTQNYLYRTYSLGHPKIPETKQNEIRSTHMISNNHVLAQAITALYKSGKSPKVFSEIKPIIELIKDPNEIEFAIECLTS